MGIIVNVNIVNDFEDEPDQNFYYTLEMNPDLNTYIGLHPMNGEIVIVDDDGKYEIKKKNVMLKHSELIQVGYVPTVYTTSKSEGMVELNVFVFSHPVDGTPRPFALSVGTSDGTACMHIDFQFVFWLIIIIALRII